MNRNILHYGFFTILAAGVIFQAVASGTQQGFPAVLLLFILAVVLVTTRTWPDRALFIVCIGEPLIVACSMMNLWAGLFSSCMLTGILYGTLAFLKSLTDLAIAGSFFFVFIIITIAIQVSNHVLLPLVAISVVAGLILLIQSIRNYQFARQYTSGATII